MSKVVRLKLPPPGERWLLILRVLPTLAPSTVATTVILTWSALCFEDGGSTPVDSHLTLLIFHFKAYPKYAMVVNHVRLGGKVHTIHTILRSRLRDFLTSHYGTACLHHLKPNAFASGTSYFETKFTKSVTASKRENISLKTTWRRSKSALRPHHHTARVCLGRDRPVEGAAREGNCSSSPQVSTVSAPFTSLN